MLVTDSKEIIINNCVLEDNNTKDSGSAISILYSEAIFLNNTQFFRNFAEKDGGSVVLLDSKFVDFWDLKF